MDKKFVLWISKLRTKRLNSLMIFITHLGTGAFVWLLMSFIFYFTGKKELSMNIIFALFINGIVCNLTLKPILRRKRPSWIDKGELLIKNPTDFSFPSGHTTSSFAAATTIFLYFKGIGIFFLFLAFLIGFSRVYHFVHYPSDVIVGAILGILIANISYELFYNYIFEILNSRALLLILK